MDKFQKKFNKRSININKLPNQIFLELTMGCNLHCPMCPVPSSQDLMNGREFIYMQPEIFNKVIEQISDRPRILWFNIMGEPLLNKHIIDYIRIAKSKGHKVCFTSNGTKMNKDLAEKVIAAGFDQIAFSIDGIKKETYEAIRIGAKFEDTYENVKYFAELCNEKKNDNKVGLIYVDCILSELTKEQKEAFLNYWEPLVDKVNFLPLDDWAGQLDLPKEFGERASSNNENTHRYPCHLLWTALYISAEGNVMLCCHDYKQQHGFPNIKDKPLIKIWREDLKKYRKYHKNGQFSYQPCSNCAWYRLPEFYQTEGSLVKRRVNVSLEYLFRLKNSFKKTYIGKVIVNYRHRIKSVKSASNEISIINEWPPKISYSQAGEDLIIRFIFDALGINKPSYLDVGAHHPFKFSNTALFYHNGSRGINIEPDLSLLREITKWRIEDLNLNIGVAKNEGSLDFYIMSISTLNTFSKLDAEKFQGEGYKILETRKIKVVPISEIITKHCHNVFPDFLSLDAEGMDEEILYSIDYEKSSPTVICVETISFSNNGTGVKNDEIIDFLKNKGYMAYADTHINTIFVRKDKWVRSILKKAVGTANEMNRVSWLKKMLETLPAGLRILDAGAGELQFKYLCSHLNYVSQDFAQYNGEGTGTGLQTGVWDQSKLDIISDITTIPEPDHSFDAIMCIEVFEHLPDPIAAIREFSRLLKNGGFLILTAPFCSLTHFAPYHYSSGFNRYFYEKHLTESGFKIISIEENGNFFEFLAQEIKRIPSVSSKYCNYNLTTFENRKLDDIINVLQELTLKDQGSKELLCFGYHILAQKSK
jgi:FkbM family methyltransferase